MDRRVVTADSLQKKILAGDPVLILDVRDAEKYRAGSLTAQGVLVKNLPYVAMCNNEAGVQPQLASIPPNCEIVTVCTTGNKAQKAADWLRERGLRAAALDGGLTAWKEWIENNR